MGNSELERARQLLADALGRLSGDWTVDGELVRGPGRLAVRVAELHAAAPAHLDVGFMVDRTRDEAPVIWDCTVGIGRSDEEKLWRAVETWATCTAQVVLELYEQNGRFADHYRGDDPDGFAGWHAIHGAWLGWGTGEAPSELQRWALEHPLLPQLRAALLPELDRSELNGVKIFFGTSPAEDTAEVRVNGAARNGPSAALLALPWPRPAGVAYVRAFVLLVHQDGRGR